jgi:uncharacterized membrane protein YphA (DoxX/SURF4 family)
MLGDQSPKKPITPMGHVFTAARILLGLIFLVFSLNYWLQFLPIPGQPEGSHGANFMGAIFATKFLTVVKILELVAAVLLLSGRYVNLALVLLGPIIVNIALFHILVAPATTVSRLSFASWRWSR